MDESPPPVNLSLDDSLSYTFTNSMVQTLMKFAGKDGSDLITNIDTAGNIRHLLPYDITCFFA